MRNSEDTLHHLSTDLQFLIACCQCEPSQDAIYTIRSYLNADPLPLNGLINLAHQHGILPLVYKTLKKISSTTELQGNSLTPQILTELKQHYTAISQRNMLISAELIHIMKLFKENNIESLAFKGPALSEMVYGDITLRQYGDLDILIKKKDRTKMVELMKKEGYMPEIILKKSTLKTFFNSVNVIGFSNASNGVRIEIHWELLSKNYAIDWDEKNLWSTKQSRKINQHEIPVLTTEQLLLYICAHGSKHLFERLEWICDIDRTVKSSSDIDWKPIINEAEKLGIKRMLYLGLSLSQLFFGLQLPEIIQKHIEKDSEVPKLISRVIEVNFSYTSQQEKSYSSFSLLLSMRENLCDKLRFTWRGIFSPKFDDFVFVQLPKYLTFLYPVVRPYRLLTKYFNR